MKSTIKALKFLANSADSSWKVGKSDSYIKTISSKISNIPPSAFDSFYIDNENQKPISTIDFAVMTYDMSPEDTVSLMNMYSVNKNTLQSVLNIADEIAELMADGQERKAKEIGEALGLSQQKVSALARQMVEDGALGAKEERVKGGRLVKVYTKVAE